MTGRLFKAEEATSLGLINHLVARDQVVSKACEVARSFSEKPSVAWKRTKARFREIALSGFDEAFRAGLLGQQEAYAKGEPQAVIDAFLGKKTNNTKVSRTRIDPGSGVRGISRALSPVLRRGNG